jgi:hypothetical protein
MKVMNVASDAALPPHMAERLRLSGQVSQDSLRLRLRNEAQPQKELTKLNGKPEAYRSVRRQSRA